MQLQSIFSDMHVDMSERTKQSLRKKSDAVELQKGGGGSKDQGAGGSTSSALVENADAAPNAAGPAGGQPVLVVLPEDPVGAGAASNAGAPDAKENGHAGVAENEKLRLVVVVDAKQPGGLAGKEKAGGAVGGGKAHAGASAGHGNAAHQGDGAPPQKQEAEPRLLGAPKKVEKKIDFDLCCYNLGSNYTEDVLGFLVKWDNNKIVSPCELVSLEAFEQCGLRQSTTKESFTHFLPAFLHSEEHVNRQKDKWRKAAIQNIESLCRDDPNMRISILVHSGSAYESWFRVNFYPTRVSIPYSPPDKPRFGDLNEKILWIFPRVLNGLLVDLFDEKVKKTAAIAYFEALVNFWRTFRQLVMDDNSLQKMLVDRLQDFVRRPAARHKDNTPDVGMILSMFIAATGLPDVPQLGDFVLPYYEECCLRGVLKWRKAGIPFEEQAVYGNFGRSSSRCNYTFNGGGPDSQLYGTAGT